MITKQEDFIRKLIREELESYSYLYRYHPIADMKNVKKYGLTPYTQKSMSDRAWASGDAIKWGWDSFSSPDDEFEDDYPRIFFTPEEWENVSKDRIPLRIKRSDIEYKLYTDVNLPPDVFMQGDNVGVDPEYIEVKINGKWMPLLDIKQF
jgi:hypothetical protein